MRARSQLVYGIRQFFTARGFLEVDTPVALSAPAPELHIEAPAVELATPEGRMRRFLQPSPELPMKRLIAAGLAPIFQIAAVFRDGEFTPRHRPEFRLLEWYRAQANWTTLINDCEALLRHCAHALSLPLQLTYQGQPIDLEAPFTRITVDEAFRVHAGFSILETITCAQLADRLHALGIHTSENDSWDDLFHRAYLCRVEPALAKLNRPVFLTYYPAPLAALARLSPENPRVAERFELFAGPLELANAYGELVDATEQRVRFGRDKQARAEAGRADYPLDERFLAAMGAMPPTAGIALGLDRLLMLFLDAADIDEVQFLPWAET